MPQKPSDTVMIYPNPAKDVETTEYPYAELFRDYAAALCRPNSAVVTYGYGFGDDHINRVLEDNIVASVGISVEASSQSSFEPALYPWGFIRVSSQVRSLKSIFVRYEPSSVTGTLMGLLSRLRL